MNLPGGLLLRHSGQPGRDQRHGEEDGNEDDSHSRNQPVGDLTARFLGVPHPPIIAESKPQPQPGEDRLEPRRQPAVGAVPGDDGWPCRHGSKGTRLLGLP